MRIPNGNNDSTVEENTTNIGSSHGYHGIMDTLIESVHLTI